MSSTTKTLFLVRHGKSSWDYVDTSDVDRPLKYRGIRDAYEMARRLRIDQKIPELIISSPAIRALHSAVIFARVFELDFKKLKITDQLYGTGPQSIIRMIREHDDKINKLMIFGHNPDFSDVASEFSNSGYVDLPTCGLAIFDFSVDSWSCVSGKNVESEHIDFPKKG